MKKPQTKGNESKRMSDWLNDCINICASEQHDSVKCTQILDYQIISIRDENFQKPNNKME